MLDWALRFVRWWAKFGLQTGVHDCEESNPVFWLLTAAEQEPSEQPQLFHLFYSIQYFNSTNCDFIKLISVRHDAPIWVKSLSAAWLGPYAPFHSSQKSHSWWILFCLFSFSFARVQSWNCSCCLLPCQTSDDLCAVFWLRSEQAKFHTWRAQRKPLWLQWVCWCDSGWLDEWTSEATYSNCCLPLVQLGPDFKFFFRYIYTFMARPGAQRLRTALIFEHLPHQTQARLQLFKVNLLISQRLFSAEGDGCQRQVMLAHYINLVQQIKSWSDFNYCMHNLAEKRCGNSSD